MRDRHYEGGIDISVYAAWRLNGAGTTTSRSGLQSRDSGMGKCTEILWLVSTGGCVLMAGVLLV